MDDGLGAMMEPFAVALHAVQAGRLGGRQTSAGDGRRADRFAGR